MPKFDKSQYSLQQVYRFYKKRCKERGVEPVDYKEHKQILDLWGAKMVEYLALGKDVKLHQGLATLRVRKRKQEFYVDRKASKLAGKRIRKPNTHSGFFSAKIRWTRHYTKIASRGWRFDASRALTKAIAKVMLVPGGHRTYVQQATVTPKNKQKSVYKHKILNS